MHQEAEEEKKKKRVLKVRPWGMKDARTEKKGKLQGGRGVFLFFLLAIMQFGKQKVVTPPFLSPPFLRPCLMSGGNCIERRWGSRLLEAEAAKEAEATVVSPSPTANGCA